MATLTGIPLKCPFCDEHVTCPVDDTGRKNEHGSILITVNSAPLQEHVFTHAPANAPDGYTEDGRAYWL